MKSSILFSLFSLFLLTGNLFSQSNIIIISDPGVKVYLDGVLKGTLEDSRVGYKIENVEAGVHIVKVVKFGFIPIEKTLEVNKKKRIKLVLVDFEPEMNNSAELQNNSAMFGNLKVMSVPSNIEISIPTLGIENSKSSGMWLGKDFPYGEYYVLFTANHEGLIYKVNIADSLTNLYVDLSTNKIMVKVKGKANIIEEVPVNDIITKDPNIRKFFIVEEMPIFMPEKCNDHKEGQILMQKYIVGNMIYPESARENGIQGKVYISFTVNMNGFVTNVEIERGVNIILDREAIRVVKSLPRFKPGKQKGKPVNVVYTVPINFKLG